MYYDNLISQITILESTKASRIFGFMRKTCTEGRRYYAEGFMKIKCHAPKNNGTTERVCGTTSTRYVSGSEDYQGLGWC
jgi:hypothetical protein